MISVVEKKSVSGVPGRPDDVVLKVTAFLSSISVELASAKKRIARVRIQELIAEYEDKALQTSIFAQVAGIEVLNLDTPTLYPKVRPFPHSLLPRLTSRPSADPEHRG